MQPDGNPYLPSGTQIMGGAATMSAQSMIVYDPIRGQPQSGVPGVASFGNLAVADGAHGLALDYAANLTITFANPMRVFGGYFAHDLMYPNYPGGGFNNTPIYVSFLDANGNIVGSTSFDYNHPYFYGAGTGPLDWHGWQSDVAFSSVSFNRQRFAMDGLQASAVPEPSTYIAGALLLLPFGASAMRYLRNRKHNS